jgi:hypothetical protein
MGIMVIDKQLRFVVTEAMSVPFKCWRGVSTTFIILVIAVSSLSFAHFVPRASALVLYNSGNPTADDQLVLEYINRARADPFAEGQRLSIDIHEDLQNPSLVGPRPPLAMNSMLLGIAEAHSSDMYNGNYFSHTDPNGTTPFDRMIHAGYGYVRAGENMAAGTGLSATELEDLMMVDSGESGRPHRLNLLDLFNSYPCAAPCVYTEVGVGYYQGSTGNSIGNAFITEDFGNAGNTGPFLLGVVYDDRNGNNFYDIGEGIAGVTITPSSGAYYAVSSSSGGYAMPIGTSGTLTVTASGPGFGSISKTITLTGANVKLDFTPQTGGTTASQSTTPSSTTQTSSQTTQTSSSTAQTFFEQSLLKSVAFQTMPASFVGTTSPGTINGCGNTFTNSQSANCPGSFVATANLPTPSTGWEFDHWAWTGGVTCASSTANPVTCSANNSGGDLMADYAVQINISTTPASNAVVSLGSCSNPGFGNGTSFFSPIYGQAVITACNLPKGYSFSSWTCSGGLACSSSTNPTTVTFGGPGTITMNVQVQTINQTSTSSGASQSTSNSSTTTTAQSAPEFNGQPMTIFALLVAASLLLTRGKRLSNRRKKLR